LTRVNSKTPTVLVNIWKLSNYRQNVTLTAQRDALLAKLMEIHAPPCNTLAQGMESFQVELSQAEENNRYPHLRPGDKSLDAPHSKRITYASNVEATETKEAPVTHDPPDLLPDCVDDDDDVSLHGPASETSSSADSADSTTAPSSFDLEI
jgi:hypothetical protein